MGVTAVIYEIPKNIFDKIQRGQLYTTFDFLQENPRLKESDIYLKKIRVWKDWGEIYGVFKDKGAPLKYIIEGDYHHPASIEQGLDPGGYFYEGFVAPDTVSHISSLLGSYSQDTIIKELGVLGLKNNVDYDEKMLNHFQLIFDFYEEVTKRGNAIAIVVC